MSSGGGGASTGEKIMAWLLVESPNNGLSGRISCSGPNTPMSKELDQERRYRPEVETPTSNEASGGKFSTSNTPPVGNRPFQFPSPSWIMISCSSVDSVSFVMKN